MDLASSPITNARHNEHGTIDVDLEHPEYGLIPFTASPNDPEEHGRTIYARALAGEAGEIAPYQPPPAEEVAEHVRAERNELLRHTDWTQLPDVPEATRLAWEPYRQALRDVPDQPGFPHEVEWPTPPARE